jgi:hypothetical protein
MRNQDTVSGRRKSFAPLAGPDEVRQALAKAEENAARARSARTRADRNYYERMTRTWRGIADGWHVIANVDKTH